MGRKEREDEATGRMEELLLLELNSAGSEISGSREQTGEELGVQATEPSGDLSRSYLVLQGGNYVG